MNRTIRSLIVDDEVLAREGLRTLAERDPDLKIIGECVNGTEAVEAISSKHPDLVFLDIQMPELDGFQVLKRLKVDQFPYIIFVTAYDQYAIRAFEVRALDYLLKPVDEDRFQRAVKRAKEMMQSKEWRSEITSMLHDLVENKATHLERIVIKENARIFFIKTNEIDWIEAKGNYAMVHAGKKAHLIREAMTSLEHQLDRHKFFRIHRSTIVNIDRIRELQSLFHGDYRITLKDGTRLLMSRRFRDKLKEHLAL
jgi:two-component system, LytTR family, response regulator